MRRAVFCILIASGIISSAGSALAQGTSVNPPDPYLEISPPYLPDSDASSSSELWRSAVKILSDRLESNPNEGTLYFVRANVYAQLGKFPAALEDYARAIALVPNFGKAYAARSWLKTNSGQRTIALADADKAIAVAPSEFSGYVAKGRCLEFQTGGYEGYQASHLEAVALLTNAIELEPTLQDLYLQRARFREVLGDQDGVIHDMNELIRLAPKAFTPYEIRAQSWRSKGEVARAQHDMSGTAQDLASEAQDLARAAELVGGDRGYYDYCISTQVDFDIGNLSRAVETCTAALAIKPDSVDELLLRGLANDRLGKRTAVKADYDRALQVDPKAPSMMLARARELKQSAQEQQSSRLV